MSEYFTPDQSNKDDTELSRYEEILSSEGMPTEPPQSAEFTVLPTGLMYDIADQSPAPDEYILERDMQHYVRRLMGEHNTPRQRQVLTELYRSEVKPSKTEIAARIGVSKTRIPQLIQRGMNTIREAAEESDGMTYLKETALTTTPSKDSLDSGQDPLQLEKSLVERSREPDFPKLMASYVSYDRNDISPFDLHKIKRQHEQLFGVQPNWSMAGKRHYMNGIIETLDERLEIAKQSVTRIQNRPMHDPLQHTASLARATGLVHVLSSSLATAKALRADYRETLHTKHSRQAT